MVQLKAEQAYLGMAVTFILQPCFMMATVFIDDPYHPYKMCFLLATVLSNWHHPLSPLLSYSTSKATFHSKWIQTFTCLDFLKKKKPITSRLKL